MNVLVLTSSYPRFDGDPTAPFVEAMTRHVAALGHRLQLVLPESASWDRPPAEHGVAYHAYRYSPRRSWTPWGYSASLERGTRIRWPLYALAPIVALSAARTCHRVVARHGIDVVHAHWVVPNGPVAARVADRHSLPLVLSLHGSDVAVAERSPWMGRAVRLAFGRAAAVTAPSSDLLERAEALGARGRLELVPYGVDPDVFRPEDAARGRARDQLGLSPDAVVVVAVGRFVDVKGFEYLIDAVAHVRDMVPSMRLVLVGDGDLSADLKSRAADAGLGDAAVFTGMVQARDVPLYLAAADVVAVPSVRHEGYVDGLPNVALEAMSSGKPLVASRVGGLPSVVEDGRTGVLVPERDSEALAAALARLARDPALRDQLGRAARDYVERELTWPSVAARLDRIYADVVGS